MTIDGVVADGARAARRRRARASTVDGRPVAPDAHAYVLLNKPADVVTTVRDTHGRRTVVDLVGADRRLFPVGRLDADTTGLLLLTNDGELAARLMHPRHGVEKTYEATVRGAVSADDRGPAGGGHRAGRAAHGARRACASCAPRAGRASSRSCCTRAASGRCGACARRSAIPSSRCTARPTRACGSARSRPARRARCAPAEVELLRSAAADGLTWRRRASTATSRWRARHPPQRRGARARRARGRGRRRRARAVGGRRAGRERDARRRSRGRPTAPPACSSRSSRARCPSSRIRASCTSPERRPTAAWRR